MAAKFIQQMRNNSENEYEREKYDHLQSVGVVIYDSYQSVPERKKLPNPMPVNPAQLVAGFYAGAAQIMPGTSIVGSTATSNYYANPAVVVNNPNPTMIANLDAAKKAALVSKMVANPLVANHPMAQPIDPTKVAIPNSLPNGNVGAIPPTGNSVRVYAISPNSNVNVRPTAATMTATPMIVGTQPMMPTTGTQPTAASTFPLRSASSFIVPANPVGAFPVQNVAAANVNRNSLDAAALNSVVTKK